MKSKFAIAFFLLVALIIGFNSGYLLGQSPFAPVDVFAANPFSFSSDQSEAMEPFDEVYNLLQSRYFEQPMDEEALLEGAINGMLETLDDPHTRYLSPQAEIEERQGFEGEIQGIGVEVTSENDNIVVVSPIEGSPAFEAGLKPNDIIREADGIDLTGKSVMEAAMIVRGEKGTSVSLIIERDGETFPVEIIRDVIKIESVRGEILEEGIAYLRLSHFGANSDKDFERVLKDLIAEDPDGLILDLRHNPGGALDVVVDIADEFLPESTVLVQEFGDGFERNFTATDNGSAETLPLVVLVDEGSASASEVLAGAIRDNGRGILIGETTFGKGTVQTWHQLSNGGGLRITIARWLTPNETWVHDEGLKPDFIVTLPEISGDDELNDTQLQAAIDYLLGNPVIESEEAISDT